ncbi:MAG: heme ABC exporter ATP-binding protein CcmA [Pirellulaceae bacterium]|nr:heme ABC exporter ATP-binding protein CcmA [Pirellulaceae bacterium]
MADESPAVEVIGLHKRLGFRVVLQDVNLSLRRGEVAALMGANGAGKTTLLRCLAALLRPCAGEIRWLGHAWPARFPVGRWVGYAGHDAGLYPHLTVEENLLFAARMHRTATPVARVRAHLASAGLDGAADVPAGQLSQGVRRRLSILRAVVHAPAIVLLDEPSAGLDGPGRAWLREQVRRLRHTDCGVLLATHDAELARAVSDQIWRLRDGRVAAQAGMSVAVAGANVVTRVAA